MMARVPRLLLVWSLTTCLLLVAALVYPQVVPHATHHAHHTAATHASVLCAWLCAAGQGVESKSILLPDVLRLSIDAGSPSTECPAGCSPRFTPARGPPVSA